MMRHRSLGISTSTVVNRYCTYNMFYIMSQLSDTFIQGGLGPKKKKVLDLENRVANLQE